MKLNKIKLRNIRSYLNQEIEFPKGNVLLSGKVGSGKSSVLLAVDFALFGLRSGTLSGGSLLRNGENSGHVELDFELNEKMIKIRRNLRRSNSVVSQEPGFIEINGNREDLSPIELKDKILGLLNYPKELLTKNKSLIYRYTVYTPQEEMKYILLADKEHRFEILRKVFGVDKYKRIKDNSLIFLQHLKLLRKELAVKIADLEDKLNAKKEVLIDIEKLKESSWKIMEKTEEFKILINNKEKEIKLYEKKMDDIKDIKKNIEMHELNIQNNKNILNRTEDEIIGNRNRIKLLKDELKNEIMINPEIISGMELKLRAIKTRINENSSKLGALKNEIFSAQQIKDKIQKLDFCPLCKQTVTKGHVEQVVLSESRKIASAEEKKTILERELAAFESEHSEISRELEKTRENLSLMESNKLKKRILIEKETAVEKLEIEKKELEEKTSKLIEEQKTLSGKIEAVEEIEDNYKLLVNEKLKLQENHRKLELESAVIDSEINSAKKRLVELEEEIGIKLELKNKLLYWTNIQNWLADHFIQLMEIIEKKILYKVHHDFSSLFQKWFEMLIDDELIKIKLDEEFTPVIEQNGHIIDYYYLSGGEKTAVALAYRIALNQVINLLLSVIETKDLLILDEPTDGFSDVQIEKIRDIIRELKMNQIILVSHENKIEGFVDNTLRFEKKDHITEVIL